MIYEIFTFGGGEYIIEVLNAIVRVMGGNSFISAIKISLLFGLLATLFDIAVNGGFTKGIKYYVSFLLAYNILFVPKVDVIITDPLNPYIQANKIVDNVPFGLAFMGHTISSFGNWLTKTFEMNFSLPDDLQYANNGILFGSTLVKKTLSVRIADPGTTENFNNYIRQCIFTSVQLGKVKERDLIESEDIATFLKHGSSGVLAYEYIGKDNEKIIKLCSSTSEIENEIEAEVKKLQALNGNSSAMEYILNIQQDASKTFEQMLIANAIEDSTQNYLALTQADAAATNYALTKDDLQRKQTGIIQWIQANKYLPLLKITIETLFYALFPVVVLMTMLPNGFKIFKSYIMVLLSLQMWSPLYAVLNLIMTLEQKYRIGGILKETGNVITLYNKSAILEAAQGISTQAGILAWSIPVLAQKIVSGMEHFADVSGGIAQSGTHSASQLASEISSGNMSYGNGSFKNVSYDNTNANKHDTNYTDLKGQRTVQNADTGLLTQKSGNDTTTYTAPQSNVGFRVNVSEGLENAKRKDLTESQSHRDSVQESYSKSLNDLNSISNTENLGITFNDSASASNGNKASLGMNIGGTGATKEQVHSHLKSLGKSESEINGIMEQIQKTESMSQNLNKANEDVSSKSDALSYVRNTSARTDTDATDKYLTQLRKKHGNAFVEDKLANDREWLTKYSNKWKEETYFNKNTPQKLDNINKKINEPIGNTDLDGKYKNQTKQMQNRFEDKETEMSTKNNIDTSALGTLKEGGVNVIKELDDIGSKINNFVQNNSDNENNNNNKT
jgi:conjugal transfer mating pair stabilization protein TraG